MNDIIDTFVKQFAKDRAANIESELWRMIADGCLFSDGWRLAVFDYEFDGRQLRFDYVRVPPGTMPTLPDGCRAYKMIGVEL